MNKITESYRYMDAGLERMRVADGGAASVEKTNRPQIIGANHRVIGVRK